MNKREAMRLAHQEQALQSLGFTADEADKLRRISMTLRRWHELECGDGNGYIERDETSGKPRYINCRTSYLGANDVRRGHIIPDRETGAKRRLAEVLCARLDRQIAAHPDRGNLSRSELAAMDLDAYIQTDPRGAALYILRPGDIPEGSTADSCYSRGICVY
jgi:hypothetical protein